MQSVSALSVFTSGEGKIFNIEIRSKDGIFIKRRFISRRKKMDIMVNKIDNLGQSKLSSITNKTEHSNSGNEGLSNIYISKQEIESMVNTLNSVGESVGNVDRRMSFYYNEKANRVVMKIMDTQSNEVVKEIPPKEMVRLLESIHEFIGMFVDESR